MTSTSSVLPEGGIAALLTKGSSGGTGEVDAETAGLFEAALASLLGSPVLTGDGGQPADAAGEPGDAETSGGPEGGVLPGAQLPPGLVTLPAAAGTVQTPALEAIQAHAAVASGVPVGGSSPPPDAPVAVVAPGAPAGQDAPTGVAPAGVAAAGVGADGVAPDGVAAAVVDGEVPEGTPQTLPAPGDDLPVAGEQATPAEPTTEPELPGHGKEPAADGSRPRIDGDRPVPQASERAGEALRAASPAAAEHAAPLRRPAGAPAPADADVSLDAPEAVAPQARTGESQATPRAVEVRPAADARPAQPHEQVVSVLRPLRRGPDGTYRLTLQLHPHDLGRVRLEVHVRGGELAVHLTADADTARELLRDALPALQADLEQSGFDSASVDVGWWGSDDDDDAGLDDDQGPAAGTTADPATDTLDAVTVPAGAVDVRL